jgi:hypothetical protein
MALTFGLMAVGILAFGAVIPFFLEFIGSNIPYIPLEAWLLLGGLILIQRFDILCCAVSATGNEMIYYWEAAFAALIGALGLFYFKNTWGVYTPILTSILPGLILMHIGPVKKSAELLNLPRIPKYFRDFVFIFIVYFALSLVILLLTK